MSARRPRASPTRVVSMPCREWFDEQDAVLPRRGAPAARPGPRQRRGRHRRWAGTTSSATPAASSASSTSAPPPTTRRSTSEFGITAEAVVEAAKDSSRLRQGRVTERHREPATGTEWARPRQPRERRIDQEVRHDHRHPAALRRRSLHLARRPLPRAPAPPATCSELIDDQARRRRHHQPVDLRTPPSPTGDAYDAQVTRARRRPARPSTRPSSTSPPTTSRDACDLFAAGRTRPPAASDGRVSIEVDPRLAHDTARDHRGGQGSCATAVDRHNVLIKIPPPSRACRPSPQVLAEGISVNVTLIFSLDRYRAVMNAFLAGLEQAQRATATTCPRSTRSRRSSSPASTPRSTSGSTPSAPTRPRRSRARPAWPTPAWPTRPTRRSSPPPRWQALEAEAAPSRSARCGPPPASRTRPTRDTMYVTDLVAPDTVNTMPEKTLEATADHGDVTRRHGHRATTPTPTRRARLASSASASPTTTSSHVLEREGVDKFEKSWGELLDDVEGAAEPRTKARTEQ